MEYIFKVFSFPFQIIDPLLLFLCLILHDFICLSSSPFFCSDSQRMSKARITFPSAGKDLHLEKGGSVMTFCMMKCSSRILVCKVKRNKQIKIYEVKHLSLFLWHSKKLMTLIYEMFREIPIRRPVTIHSTLKDNC